MPTFEVLVVAHALVRAARDPIDRVRLRDADLARQLAKAAASVPGNINEGRELPVRSKLHHYRVSAGSNREVASHMQSAVDLGYLEQAEIAEVLVLSDRVAAMLYRLTH